MKSPFHAFTAIAVAGVCLACCPSHAGHFNFEHAYDGPWQWDEITLTHTSETRGGVLCDFYRGTAAVTGYDGSDAELSIPAQISHSWTIYADDMQGNQTPIYEFDYRVDVVEIGPRAFYSNTDLVSVSIPVGVTNVDEKAFWCCYNLASVSIPDTLVRIGDVAFASCNALESIEFPESLRRIGQNAFSGCGKLKSIFLPDGIEFVEPAAFYGCVGVETMKIRGDCMRDMFGYWQNGQNRWFYNFPTNLQRVCFTANTTNIAAGSFAEPTYRASCTDGFHVGETLASVEFPESLLIIGTNAFGRCYKLENLVFPSNLRSVQRDAFYNCTNLSSVSFQENLEYVGGFTGCENLTSVSLPKSLKTIGEGAFSDCSRLSFVSIPQDSQLESIENRTFANTAIQSLSIPAGVSSIGNNVIPADSSINVPDLKNFCETVINGQYNSGITAGICQGRWNLCVNGTRITRLVVPDGVSEIGAWQFCRCNLASISIPSSVRAIGNYAFYNCNAEVQPFQPGLESIGTCAFYQCSLPANFPLPGSVKSIGYSAFHGFDAPANIIIPTSLVAMGNYAFYGNSHSQGTLVNIPETKGWETTFYNSSCASLVRYSENPLLIVDESSLRATNGVYYSQRITAIGGSPARTWTFGPLPAGLTATSGFREYFPYASLSGTPEACGDFEIAVSVSDSIGNTAMETLHLKVVDPSSIPTSLTIVTDASLPVALTDAVYSQDLVADGGTEPYAWEIVDRDDWPDWLDAGFIDYWSDWGCENPCLSGTRTLCHDDVGTYTFALRVTDAEGTSVEKTFTLEVVENLNQAPEIESWRPVAERFRIDPGATTNLSVVASDPDGDTLTYSWSIYDEDWNRLENGDSTSASYTFSRAVGEDGTNIVEVYVSDGQFTDCHSWTVVVAEKTPLAIVTDATLPAALTDSYYNQPVEISGGEWPYIWELVDPENAPAWLFVWDEDYNDGPGFSSDWCPSEDDIGTYSFSLRVTDAEGSSVVKTFTLEVVENPNHAPVIESWSPVAERFRLDPGATTNLSVVAYDPDGDDLTFRWVIQDENWNWLEDGASTGPSFAFSRAAEQRGTFVVGVEVSDGERSSYQNWTVKVAEKTPLEIVTDEMLPVALTDVGYWQQVVASGGEEPYVWEIVDEDDWPDWLGTWDLEENGCLSGYPYSENIGTSTFALRVTDAEGSNVVKTFTLEVQENPNPPPVIDSYSPDHGSIRLEPGTTQTFSVEAHDPKGDPISFYWYVYDPDDNRLYRSESGGETNEFSWTFDAAVTGTYEVSVEVADGSHSSYCYWYVAASIPKTIYVDQASTADDPDGTSWETAYPTLGDALDDIEIDDTVLVAPGAYECPWLPGGIELKSRDGAATTFLGAVPGYDGLRVDGFTFEEIRHSYPSSRPYAVVPPGSTLVGCTISGCSAPGRLLSGCKLEDCVVSGCSSDEEILCECELRNSVVSGCSSGDEILQECELKNCIVSDCESARDLIGGCDLENCAVVGNTSGYDILSGCRLWNCTVAGNTLLSWYSAVDQSSSAWNSVLWGNYGIDDMESGWRWPESVDYGFWWDDATGDYTDLRMTELHDCCVEGIWDIALTLQNEYGRDYDPDALGLIEEPPDFVDIAHGDVRLRTGSPCLDAGAAAWVRGSTDVAGNARIQGAAVDLGAYEGSVDGFVLSVRVVGSGTVSPMTAVVPAGGSATFTASESAGRPFQGWTVGGADVGTAATYTWSDVQTDGELVATFGSFSFRVDAATGDDANDGLSWAAPKATIQAAVEASVDGESVLVKPGVYGPVDTAGKAVRIESTNGKAATVIDGGGTNRCAFLGTGVGHGAKLVGFALRNGNAAWNASPKAGMGGGAYGGTLLDCDVTGCGAHEKGGGLAYSEAHRCAIVGNGIFDDDERGTDAYGGGAYECDLYSCLIASNAIVLSLSPDDTTPAAKAYGGGAAWGSLYQCTVADNSIQSDDLATGGGWYADWGELNGSIFYGNTANGAASDVENWEGSVSFEQSLVGVDPLFVDRANGDYRLRQDSPAVDAGFSSTYEWRGPPSESIADLDLDGNPRVRGLCIDLGCYESGYTATDKATSTTPEPVPYAWLNENATNAVKGAWGGYEAAAKATAANGRPVWECYVADLDPEDENDDLVADIEMVDGRPVVTILKGEKASREYETQGAPAPGGPWGKPDDGSRFFRVKVSLP